MFVAKIFTQLAMPVSGGGSLIGFGILALLFRRRVLGGGLALAGLAWLWLLSTPLFSDCVRGTLESQYPPAALEATPAADAIVVLGGAVQPAVPPRSFPDLGSASDRVWHGARLFHAGRAPLLVLSGGNLPWREEDGPESNAMLEFVTDLGVPQKHVLIESQSATTHKNALETARMLAEYHLSRVLLVTSALHMRRAEAAFRAVGLDVVPAATDHEAVEQARTLLDVVPGHDHGLWHRRQDASIATRGRHHPRLANAGQSSGHATCRHCLGQPLSVGTVAFDHKQEISPESTGGQARYRLRGAATACSSPIPAVSDGQRLVSSRSL